MGLRTFMVLAVLVFAVGFTARLTYEQAITPAYAQSQQDIYDCEDFRYQEEAQDIYDRDPSDPYGLDGPVGEAFTGQQGLACEELPSRGDDSAGENQYDNGTDDAKVRPPQGDSRRTPRTGGPDTEVFPLMDDGTCPTPLVKRNGACYP